MLQIHRCIVCTIWVSRPRMNITEITPNSTKNATHRAALPEPPSRYGGLPRCSLQDVHLTWHSWAALQSCQSWRSLPVPWCQLSGGVGCPCTALMFILSSPLPANTLSVKRGGRGDAPALHSSPQLILISWLLITLHPVSEDNSFLLLSWVLAFRHYATANWWFP